MKLLSGLLTVYLFIIFLPTICFWLFPFLIPQGTAQGTGLVCLASLFS